MKATKIMNNIPARPVSISTVHISGVGTQLRHNINMDELFKPKLTGGGGWGCEWDCPEILLDGLQFFSDLWHPVGGICVTSSYRPYDKSGFHRYGKAIDFVTYNEPLNYIENFKIECLNHRDSALIKGLRKIGIAGFGIEDKCIHIDTGNRVHSDLYPKDEYGEYCVFTWRPAVTAEERKSFPNGISKLIK